MIATLGMGTPPQGANGQPQQGSLLSMFAPLVIIFIIFYFLLIRPQKTQQKKLQQMLQNIRKGDAVVTRGGLHGTVAGISDNIITLEIADNVKVKMAKDAIIHVATAANS